MISHTFNKLGLQEVIIIMEDDTMNNKLLLSLVLVITAVMAGCGTTDNTNNADSDGDRDQIMAELNPARDKQPNNSDENNKLGFVRYSKDQLDEDTEKDHNVTIDRTKLADMITRIILRNDGFQEVATLVTDEEVLIAYAKGEDIESGLAAEIAKKTAVSVMPGYFDVYVSENETLMLDIQSLHNSSVTDGNYDNTINQIIEEMKKTPQGREE